MPITRTSMIDDDGSGTTGTIINNAWKTELYDQIDGTGALGGFWTGVPFSASNFTSSGTWTVSAGNVAVLHWITIGRTVFVAFRITGTMTLTTSAGILSILLPAAVPLPALPYLANPFTYYMTGANGTGIAEIQNARQINLTRDIAGTAFPAFTSAFLIGQLYYPY